MGGKIPDVKRAITLVVIWWVSLLAIFVLFEGMASTILFFRELIKPRQIAERVHTQHDELLGWVNLPDFFDEDIYGRGIYVRTNSQSFRNSKVFSTEVPPDKLRFIYSGDSFTFGYGVDNKHSWGALLASTRENIEGVNMGQGGYGVGQAYLWYMRDGIKLDHDVHIFAFINGDFIRMRSKVFAGYDKPYLTLRDGKLRTENVPVPERTYRMPWLTNYREIIENLRSFVLLRKIYRKVFPASEKNRNVFAPREDSNQLNRVTLKIFENLRDVNRSKNSKLVLLYLPTEVDYRDRSLDEWRKYLADESRKRGIPFIDLIKEFRLLDEREVPKMFLSGKEVSFRGAAGHYSNEGNRYVAGTLYEKLLSIPGIGERLR